MNNPIKEYKRMFRVIGGEYPDLVGKELELHTDYITTETVELKFERTTTLFKKSDVQELTPLSFNNRRIAIGDEVMINNHNKWNEWYIVFGYHWYDGIWILETVNNDNWENGCLSVNEDEVQDHRTPQDNKIDLSDDELLEEVRKRGLIESKEVVK
jgi:hypothetical protein